MLDVTRLHATLATGAITSKREAGEYALGRFAPVWHPIIEEAIRVRERRPEPSRFNDPRHAAKAIRLYMAMVIDDALAMPGPMPSDQQE